MFEKSTKIFIQTSSLFNSSIFHKPSTNSIRKYSMRHSSINIKEINEVNEALIVLRHFIDLSSRLLPYYEELKQKDSPSEDEVNQMNKIAAVYDAYNIDPSTSKILIESDILKIIFDSYAKMKRNSSEILRKMDPLKQFWREYRKLSENWNYALSN